MQAAWRSLGDWTNPPIKEALVDFRTERGKVLDPKSLESLWPQVRERFPRLEVRNKMQMEAGIADHVWSIEEIVGLLK
jgi:hypothetical protein